MPEAPVCKTTGCPSRGEPMRARSLTARDRAVWTCQQCKVSVVDATIHCPACGRQHLDIGEFATHPHGTHLCENTPEGPGTGCGHEWRPFKGYTPRGVASLTGDMRP